MTCFRGFLLLSLLFTLVIKRASGQRRDDTLQEVDIHTHVKKADVKADEFAPGQKVKIVDTLLLQQYRLQNMATLLAQQEPVFVKSYGFNGLATLSFRGASSAQSQVYWNGVPIQNAALGVADVSALPVLMMNNINIVYGGSSALWGSGNVGGALLLNSGEPVFGAVHGALDVSVGAGSFGQYSGAVKGACTTGRWYFSGAVFAQTAQDNFPYTTLQGLRQMMPNDQLQSESATASAAYRADSGTVLRITAWGQAYNREIPPALFEPYSEKNELDQSMRVVAEWNRNKGGNEWYVRSSLTDDIIDYTDAEISVKAGSTVYQYFQEAGWKRKWNNRVKTLVFLPVQETWMLVAPGSVKYQDKVAVAGAANYTNRDERLDVAVNAREEQIDNTNIFLPGSDASYRLTDWLRIRGNVQETYRAPTLNELYYVPGGNTTLLPEHGWNADAGYNLHVRMGRVALYHDLSAYYRDIKDWIIWYGGAIWTPHNIAEVLSRGVETENRATMRCGKWTLHAGVNTGYVIATTLASSIPGDGSIGKQIPYVPRYNGQASIGATYHGVTLSYNHTYTGYRFITADESEYLLPYQTGNVQALYDFRISGRAIQWTGQWNNIWNEQYQVVAGRPMPGANWLTSVKISLL